MVHFKTYISILFLPLFFSTELFGQQFQATIKDMGNNTLGFYIKPTSTGSVSFTDIEFSIQYPNTYALTFSLPVLNTTDFRGLVYTPDILVITNPLSSNNAVRIGGSFAPTTSNSYTSGTEYLVYSVKVSGGSGSVPFQLVHNAGFDPYYLALTNSSGGDVAPTDPATYFYPTTNSFNSGVDNVYFYQINAALPVELVDFTAKKENTTDALLNWYTASEHHSDRYEVERSFDGQSWGLLGSVKAAGESSNKLAYTYLDERVPGDGASRSVYYRLKMVDIDETFTYSATRSVSFDGKGGVTAKLYPNPATRVVHVSLSGVGVSVPTTVTLTDLLGREVLRFSGVGGEQEVALDGLVRGAYFVRGWSGEQSVGEVVRLVVY